MGLFINPGIDVTEIFSVKYYYMSQYAISLIVGSQYFYEEE